MAKLHQRLFILLGVFLLMVVGYSQVNQVSYQDISEQGEELLESIKRNVFNADFLPDSSNSNSVKISQDGLVEKQKVVEQIAVEKEKEEMEKAEKEEKEREREREKEREPQPDLCTAIHPLTNGFYDLKELGSLGSEGKVTHWNAKGYDYGKNFTLSVCSTPFKQQQEVQDVANSSTIGAYYIEPSGSKVSIGDFSTAPHFRGKKLTLTYENGSYCDSTRSDGTRIRKSTILSFTCDREIMQKASVSFVGVLNDCDYFFEVRSVHACPTAQKSDNLAVIWIFLLILFAALAVYCSGGFIYKRIVLNHRGWKQLPNYGVLSGFKAIIKRVLSSIGVYNARSYNDFGFLEDQNNLLDALDIDDESLQ